MKKLDINNLELFPIKRAHAELLFEPLQDEKIYTYFPEDAPESLEKLQKRYEYLQKGKSPDGDEYWLNWVVFTKQDKIPVGVVQATVKPNEEASIAYIIFPDYWSNGYGKNATKAIIDYIFDEFDIPKIIAQIDTRNERSIKMVESLKMSRARIIKEADFFKGTASDEYEYEITKETWNNPPARRGL